MSGAVEGAAIRFDEAHVLAFFDVGRAFEHHVLEEVRKAGAAFFLGARSDIVDHVDGDHGQRVVARQNHAEAVIELVFWIGISILGGAAATAKRRPVEDSG